MSLFAVFFLFVLAETFVRFLEIQRNRAYVLAFFVMSVQVLLNYL